jgi:outer membrane protein assembly factor BamB
MAARVAFTAGYLLLGPVLRPHCQAAENAGAGNWPKFRGPDGTGYCERCEAPARWNESTGENVLWKVPVPLYGASSPVVWGKRVFLTAADASERKVLCFDAESGRCLWAEGYRETGANNDLFVYGDHVFAAGTPVTDGERVVATFANGDVACFSITGEVSWARNLGDTSANSYGQASSLALHSGRVFAQIDHGPGLWLVALDINTGEELWRAEQNANSWASPLVIETQNGHVQVVTVADPTTSGWDVASGARLWSADLLAGDLVPSPTYACGRVIVTLEYNGMFAIDPSGTGNVRESHIVWQVEDLETAAFPDVCSPATDGRLVYVSAPGALACIEALTGRVVYEQILDVYTTSASPIVAGGRLYVFAEEKTLVVEAGTTFSVVGEGSLEEAPEATPAFVGDRIYLRGPTSLYCIGSRFVR